ncbi:hypothetical protein IWW50_004705 [Coemansia erecta]|nr:hypothetical protein GGF43_004052 [Coemansia sp. RSA 2618]KAJ2821271.1 hypothetical protein IWW50_004705 [Coemansia erecta]
MSAHVPLSLRRKVVVVLDPEQLLPSTTPLNDRTADEAAQTTTGRFSAFKALAWAKANVIRTNDDHVFLVTSLDPTASGLDKTVLSAMWESMVGDRDPHTDAIKTADAELERLSGHLSRCGVSVTHEVLRGSLSERVPEYVHEHRGEILVVQAPVRGAWVDAMAYSWADVCVRKSECPVLVVKPGDVADEVARALDPID